MRRWTTRQDGSFGPPRHWYFIAIYECPVCGRGEEIRERRYGRRPADPTARHEFVQRWDYCNAF